MLIFETKVLDIIQRTPNVKSFRFEPVERVDFKPGQFFFVTIKINDKERTKHFSFSNSPAEREYVEFTKRLTGSEFSNALNNLKIGDWAKLKMPYGGFTLDYVKDRGKKIAFLSGGIGVTPIRSMCKYIVDGNIDLDVKVIYGNRTEKDIVFKKDFDTMESESDKINVIYTLDSPEDSDKWNGRKGLITPNMIKQEIPDYKERIFYICGPPKMVEGLVAILKDELRLGEGNIKLENFTGY